MRLALVLVAGILLAGIFAAMTAQADDDASDPRALRRWISLRFPGTQWIATDALARWLSANGEEIVLLDAREPAEFAVSQLRGARRVDPASDALDPRDLPRDRRVVVYCAVGYRSAAVASRLRRAGHERVWNLEGGLFQWANEGRPLFRGDDPATRVHPFDEKWGRMLDPRLHAPGRADGPP